MKNIFILCITAILFSGCEKCFECTQSGYRYCLEYTVTVNGVSGSDTDCYTTESARDAAVDLYESFGYDVTISEGNVELASVPEFCGKAADTDDVVETWETLGYDCAKQ